MKTKFTFKALLVYILSIAFLYLFILIIPRIFIEGDYSMPLFPKIFLPSIITFLLLNQFQFSKFCSDALSLLISVESKIELKNHATY